MPKNITTPRQPKKVVIIGAGIGGLAAANMLAKAGYDVSIYEKNRQLGGRAGKRKIKGFTFDTGPSWYLMPEVFDQYFSLFTIDVKKELSIKKLAPAYKVFYESSDPITVHGNLTKDARQFEAIEAGAGKKLETYVKEGGEIYRMALKHFLYTNFSDPRDLLNKEVLQQTGRMAKLLLTDIHSRVEKFVTAKPLQQILEYPMVFLGTSPFKAPAMYSLMSALDFKEGVFYPNGGIYSIIELIVRIGKKLGVAYHLNADVQSIIHKNGKATGIQVAGKTILADIVISNADLHHTETKLLDTNVQSYPESSWSSKEPGISALLLYIGVKGSLPQLEHHNLFFVDKWEQNFIDIYEDKKIPTSASLYASRTTATDPSTAPKGHENIFVLVPLPTGISLTKEQQATLTDRFLIQIATAIKEPDLLKKIVSLEAFGPNDFTDTFNSWKGTALGMSHLLKQSAMWRIPNKSKKLQNLYYVGASTVPGIGLPMCLISAELVYKRITGIKRGGPVQSIESV
jgi:phytoene desaturase